MDDHAVAQHSHLRVALDHAFLHEAAGDGADFRDLEYLPHLDQADDALFALRREHPGQRRLHFLDGVVNDVVVAHIDAGGLDQLACGRVSPRVEADDHGTRCKRQVDVRLGNPADTRVHHADLDFLGREARQGVRECFLRALYVGLDQQGKGLLATGSGAAFAHVAEHVLQVGRALLRELDLAVLAGAEERDFARLFLVGEHDHFLACARHVGQALDLHGNRRAGALHRLAVLVKHCPHAAIHGAHHHHVAALEGPGLHQQRRHRAAALVQARLDDHALRGGTDRRLEFQHLGLQQDLLQQRIDAFAGLGRHGNHRRFTAEILGHDAVLQQVVLDPLRIGFMLVDLVDCNHQRHPGRLGVGDRLYGLRHGAVVRRHHQHDDIGHFRAARAHGCERFVAGRIQERDDAARCLHVIGADVLRNAARLAGGDLGRADVVEQRSLAVVDVAHDGDDRRPRYCIGGSVDRIFHEKCLGIVQLRRLGRVPHVLDHDHGRLLVEDLVDRRHGAQLHQHLDYFDRLDRHAVRQFANRDRLRNGDVPHHRLGRLRERRFPGRRGSLPLPRPAPAVPAADTAAHVAAGLDRPPARRVIPQDGGLLDLLGFLVALGLARLGRVQRAILGRGIGRRSWNRAFGLLLFRLALLALLLLAQFAGLDFRQLLLAPVFVLAQLQLFCIWTSRRGGLHWSRRRRGNRRGCRRRHLRRGGGSCKLGRIALDEDPLLAHLDLNGARLAHGVGFLDFAGLLARQRDLVLRFDRAVRLAQVLEQPRLVLFRQGIVGNALFNSGRAQLLEQYRGRNLQFACKLGDAGQCHVIGPL